MADLNPPSGDWFGLSAFIAALGSLVTSLLRGPKRSEIHGVRGKAQEAVNRVASVEGKLDGINSRLTAIESGQRELASRIDRVLERL